jgi:tRNA threonylcarbamoyladenosine biosynthesis protein TsaB
MSAQASSVATVLAFDTSTNLTHIGLQVGERQWVQTWPGGPAASLGLIGQCQALLAKAGLTLANLDAIAFGSGPGSFTGLRTACAVAQGLALAAQKPVIAVPTLAAVAVDAFLRQPAPGGPMRVCAALDARMSEVYVSCYEVDSDNINEIGYNQAISPENLVLNGAATLAGNAHLAYADRLSAQALGKAVDAAPSGAALLQVAQWHWRSGLLLDAALAQPSYVRNKVAQTEAERAAAKLAAGVTA